ncbi:hypothetical protein FNJ09_19850 [Salmonella enterica subsp. salamae]|nr:hypothetical protein [Salmonella enterica subsp. salamae]
MLGKTGFTHSDLLCWRIDYAGGALNVNGTIMRDTYRVRIIDVVGICWSGQSVPWKARQPSVKHHHQRPGPAAYSLTRPGYEPFSNLANTDPTECGLHVSTETVRKLMIAEKTGNHALLPTPDSDCRRH